MIHESRFVTPNPRTGGIGDAPVSLECQKCSGRAEFYLCKQCITWLRKQLLGMPTLIEHLRDTSIGNTRLSNEQSRKLGFESRTPVFDSRATDLIEEIDSTLYRWAMRLVWRHHYVISPPITWHRLYEEYVHTSADFATFLAAHTADLANDEYVGELCDALNQYAKRGVGMINRRTPEQFCGPCPTLISGGAKEHRRCVDHDGVNTCGYRDHECATRLMARRGALEVVCGTCGVTHGVQRLVNHLLARADDFRGTIPELYRVMRMLNTPVEMSTLYTWAGPKSKRGGSGQLKPAGFLRPDNRRISVSRHGDKDKPVYRVGDVRHLREKSTKPGRVGRPLKSKGVEKK